MNGTIKQPIIRKGQRKPYVKGTRKQITERIAEVALLLSCGLHKTEIHSLLRTNYGVEWRQTDRYMTRARVNFFTRSPYTHCLSH